MMAEELITSISIKAPYLVFVGDVTQHTFAKTGLGLVQWAPDRCTGQLRLTPDAVDLGLPDMNVEQAIAAGVRSLVIGTASVGGRLPDLWLDAFCLAARNGLDIVGGLHSRLSDNPILAEAAMSGDARLVDVRVPPDGLPVASGKKRTGKRLLTVGTDCALGKKYTALQLEKDMRAAGYDADFRASGQTGIMIAGSGLPLDAVVADFISGAAEVLSPANEADHWDIVEGQGSLFHPGFGGVSYGLLLGSQPDALVLCHEAGRSQISGWPDYPVPSLGEAMARNLDVARLTNPDARFVGISLNTSKLTPAERESHLARIAQEHALPCVDPLIEGTGAIVERIAKEFGEG